MMPASRQSSHFLFVLWAGGGNVPPQLNLARRLTERGHRVSILAPQLLRSRIEAAGGVFLPLHEVPEHDSASLMDDLAKDWEARSPMSAATRFRDGLIFGTALAYSKDVTAAIEEVHPDVVAPDYLLLGAYVAAERAGIPIAALVHTIYPLPAPGMPPYGMGFQPARGVVGYARDAIFSQVFSHFYNARLGILNEVRAASGLRPLTSVFEQFAHADRLLILSSQTFDFPATALPANVRYIGPQLEDANWVAPWQSPTAGNDHRPLVLVSLSTTYQRQEEVTRRIVAALATLPVRGLVTLGPALNKDNFTFPPNVSAETYIPHILVCPQVDLVVTHAGLGTVTTALNFGKPLVCIPMGRDQGDNAARVVYRGAGIQCASTASVNDLRSAIQRALNEPRFREGAQRIADGMAREGGPAVGVAEMERLAMAPSPTTRGVATSH
ncbi:MAG TPA: nucleotide disphospho-sugar-binding domain-containing protein [Ktedonobacterales bacterium]